MESINWNSVGLIVGVLGLIGTIIGVALAIYYANRKKRPNQLKYTHSDFFNIYKTLLSNKFKLDIKYAGTPITNNVFYISGKLVVEGDIKTEHNEISIELPEGCKWIDTYPEQSNQAINTTFKKDINSPRKANLTFDKFRQEDYIIVSGIIEGEHLQPEITSDFQNNIKFFHRIDDTDDVKVEDPSKHQRLISILIGVLGLLAAFISIISFLGSSRDNRRAGVFMSLFGPETNILEPLLLSIISASIMILLREIIVKNKLKK